MNDQPLVSVLILTYNQERYIAQAITCALAQKTDFPFEMVIGEDCSTDGTRQIVLEYQEKYPQIIRVVTSDENVGMMRNFLRTIEACRGKYIAFCDGDDYWHNPEKLQIQVDFLENHPDYGMVHGAYRAYFEETRTFRSWDHTQNVMARENVQQKMLAGQYMCLTSTLCARKRIVRQVVREDREVFDERFMLGDVQLVVGLAIRAKVKYLDTSFATYRVVPESAIHSRCPARKLAFQQSRRDVHLLLWERHKLGDHLLPLIKANVDRPLLSAAYWCRDRETAAAAMKELADCDAGSMWRHRVYYLGLKYPVLDLFLRPMLLLRRFLRRNFFTRAWWPR